MAPHLNPLPHVKTCFTWRNSALVLSTKCLLQQCLMYGLSLLRAGVWWGDE